MSWKTSVKQFVKIFDRTFLMIVFTAIGGLTPGTPLDFTRRCPICIKQNLDGKTIPGSGAMTHNTCASFDTMSKDGSLVHHFHDCNTTTWDYSCSRGHKWQVLDYGHSCVQGDWPRPKPEVIIP